MTTVRRLVEEAFRSGVGALGNDRAFTGATRAGYRDAAPKKITQASRKRGRSGDGSISLTSGATTLLSMTKADLLAIADRIDRSYQTTNYRNVLSDREWLQKYQLANKIVHYCQGTSWINVPCELLPCHECGYAVPPEAMTVDHFEPQSGGGVFAIVRVFRALREDLTVSDQSGRRSPVGGKFVVPTLLAHGKQPQTHSARTRIDTKRYAGSAKTALVNRHSLSDKGTLLYSVIRFGSLQVADPRALSKICMNSKWNLVPLCAGCNSSKNNVQSKYSSL